MRIFGAPTLTLLSQRDDIVSANIDLWRSVLGKEARLGDKVGLLHLRQNGRSLAAFFTTHTLLELLL